MQTHETFIQQVADLALARLPEEERRRFKLVYGYGQSKRILGRTIFDQWTPHDGGPPIPIVEICALGQTTVTQMAGTTLHELGHVIAGFEAGHSYDWKRSCKKLGLLDAKRSSTWYDKDRFDPELAEQIAALALPGDGLPVGAWGEDTPEPPPEWIPPACNRGDRTRGGQSRGVGSGSRMLKATCPGCGFILRSTAKWFNQGMPFCHCGNEFEIAEEPKKKRAKRK